MTTSVLSACETFAKCADDPQVLELLQITAIRHERTGGSIFFAMLKCQLV